jgi:hypothetical protein
MRAPAWLMSMALLALANGCAKRPPTLALPDDSASVAASAMLACQYGESAIDDPAPLAENEPVTAGQATEEMAFGKRLFDANRFPEAILVLQRVVDGETRDDAGNVQIAQYHLGVSLVKVRQFERALAVFEPIAHDPSHLQHRATAVWLAALLAEPITTVRAVDLLYLYRDADIAALDTPAQRRTLYMIQLARARGAYRRAHYDEALAILERVRTFTPLRGLADGCTAFASSARKAPRR